MRKVEKRLREKLKQKEMEIYELYTERERFRNHFRDRFRWYIKLLGNNQYPDMKLLVEAEAKFLQTVKSWRW